MTTPDTNTEGTEHRVLHFVVEGAFIADLAREHVMNGRWDDGLRTLTESFEGMSVELAVRILKGEADLCGSSSDPEGIALKELPPGASLTQDMSECLQRQYGQVFRHQDHYYRPYAVVTSWCEADYRYAQRADTHTNRAGQWKASAQGLYFGASRSAFYADNRTEDLVIRASHPSHKHPTVVLAKRCEMPPLWMKALKGDPADLVTEMLCNGARWPERGADPEVREPLQTVDEAHEHAQKQEDAREAAQARARAQRELASRQQREAQQQREQQRQQERAQRQATANGQASQLTAEFLQRLNAAQSHAEISQLGSEFEARFQNLESDVSCEHLDARDHALELHRQRQLEGYRQRIAAQADTHGGWLTLSLRLRDGSAPQTGPTQVRVPKNAFLLWCLKGFDFEANAKERPVWSPVCPQGMKMTMDDPYHSDWMLGAGLDLDETYSLDDNSLGARVMSAAFGLRATLVEEWTQAQFVTLAKGTRRWISGEVVFPSPNEGVPAGSIAVVPHAGPEYQLAMESACEDSSSGPGAIICATGGKLAHLAVVGRELDCTVLMIPDAMTRFKPGDRLSINLQDGVLHPVL